MSDQIQDEFRCFCSETPLIGLVKKDKFNNLYFHVKVFKNRQVYGEIFMMYGAAKFRCRCCYRLHTVKFEKGRPKFIPTQAEDVNSA